MWSLVMPVFRYFLISDFQDTAGIDIFRFKVFGNTAIYTGPLLPVYRGIGMISAYPLIKDFLASVR